MIVEISVVPIGVGESLSKYVAEVVKVFKKRGVKHEVTAMGTIFEVDSFSELCEILNEVNEKLFSLNSPRNYFVLKIDVRKKRSSMEEKVKSVLDKI